MRHHSHDIPKVLGSHYHRKTVKATSGFTELNSMTPNLLCLFGPRLARLLYSSAVLYVRSLHCTG